MKAETRTEGSAENLWNVYFSDEGHDNLLLDRGNVLVIRHDIDRGYRQDIHEAFKVRRVTVSRPYFEDSGDYGPAFCPCVFVALLLKHHRRWRGFTGFASQTQFFTFESRGHTIFDSRCDIPWPAHRHPSATLSV